MWYYYIVRDNLTKIQYFFLLEYNHTPNVHATAHHAVHSSKSVLYATFMGVHFFVVVFDQLLNNFNVNI